MRKLFVVTMIVLAFCAMGMAQDLPKAEVFGGYSFYRADIHELKDAGGLDKSGLNLNGWNAAVTGFMTKNFGITADFSGNYGKPTISVTDAGLVTSTKLDTKIHNFLFGPTLAYRTDRGSAFVHGLFGGTKVRMSVPAGFVGTTGSNFNVVNNTAFAWALGGGLDINAGKNFAIRVGQFDWINSKVDTTNEFQAAAGLGKVNDRQNNIRFSAGIVLKF